MIAIAQKVESRPVNLGLLEEYLPEVPVEDQVKVGLGWDSQWQRSDKKRGWGTFVMESHYGDHQQHYSRDRRTPLAASALSNGVHHEIKVNGLNSVATASAVVVTTAKDDAKEEEAEDELEEWEIEAERRFQDSDDDDAPSLASPASSHSSSSSNSKRLSVKPNVLAAVMAAAAAAEAAAAAAVEPAANEKSNAAVEKVHSRDQGQVKRRKKMWPRK